MKRKGRGGKVKKESIVDAIDAMYFKKARRGGVTKDDEHEHAHDTYSDPDDVEFFHGSTFIHFVSRVSPGRIELFLDRGGADINKRDDLGKTPLHIACQHSSESVRILLKRGADVNIVDDQGSSALHYSCIYSPQLIGTLLDRGANENVFDLHQRSPLYYLCMNWPDDLEEFLDPRLNLNIQNERGNTVLHQIQWDEPNNVCALLRIGVDVNVQDKAGNTALHKATLNHDIKIINELIDYGANPNLRDMYSRLPLHLALTSCHSTKLIRRLYDATAGEIGAYQCPKLDRLIALYGALAFKRKLPGLPSTIITPYLVRWGGRAAESLRKMEFLLKLK